MDYRAHTRTRLLALLVDVEGKAVSKEGKSAFMGFLERANMSGISGRCIDGASPWSSELLLCQHGWCFWSSLIDGYRVLQMRFVSCWSGHDAKRISVAEMIDLTPLSCWQERAAAKSKFLVICPTLVGSAVVSVSFVLTNGSVLGHFQTTNLPHKIVTAPGGSVLPC